MDSTNAEDPSVLVVLNRTEVEILEQALESYKEEMFDVCIGEETEGWYKATLSLCTRIKKEKSYFCPREVETNILEF